MSLFNITIGTETTQENSSSIIDLLESLCNVRHIIIDGITSVHHSSLRAKIRLSPTEEQQVLHIIELSEADEVGPQSRIINGMEYVTNGYTVWVNASDGMCIGRFAPTGIDIHHTSAGQEAGKHCIACTHGKPDIDGWEAFRKILLEHHQAQVPASYRPKWLPQKTA